MTREIRLDVVGDNVHASRKRAGIQGEGNVTDVVISFDESWDGYAKKITWWDAVEQNPVERTLTADLLMDIANDTRTYKTTVPAEPLALEGECTLVIDGYADGKRARSIAVRLEVEPAPIADNAGEPVDPTPTQAEQLQRQIEALMMMAEWATDKQVSTFVSAWLDAHPEATTTVQDNTITELKIAESFLPYIKNEYVTPEIFGAVGDGVTDDTAAIQAALNSGKRVVFDGAKVYAASALTITDKAGPIDFHSTTIKKIATGHLITLSGTHGRTLQDLNFVDNGTALGHYIYGHSVVDLIIRNVNLKTTACDHETHGSWAYTLAGDNITIKDCDIDCASLLQWGDGIHLGSCTNVLIENCVIHSGDDAIAILPANYMGASYTQNALSDNIIVRDCVLDTDARAVIVGIKGNTANAEYGDYAVQNVKIINCVSHTCKKVLAIEDDRTAINAKHDIEFIGCKFTVDNANSDRAIYVAENNGTTASIAFTDCQVSRTSGSTYFTEIRNVDSVEFNRCAFADTVASTALMNLFRNCGAIKMSGYYSSLNSMYLGQFGNFNMLEVTDTSFDFPNGTNSCMQIYQCTDAKIKVARCDFGAVRSQGFLVSNPSTAELVWVDNKNDPTTIFTSSLTPSAYVYRKLDPLADLSITELNLPTTVTNLKDWAVETINASGVGVYPFMFNEDSADVPYKYGVGLLFVYSSTVMVMVVWSTTSGNDPKRIHYSSGYWSAWKDFYTPSSDLATQSWVNETFLGGAW